MSRIDTGKPINPTQLCVELGRVPLRHVEGDHVEVDSVDVATLAAAVDAHVADPDYVDPLHVPPSPPATFEEKVATALEDAQDFASFKQTLVALLA